MQPGYYEIGWGGHIVPKSSYKDDPIYSEVAGPRSALRSEETGQVELVLGIRPNGAPSLHLTIDQTRLLSRAIYIRKYSPAPPSDFISLSPISFRYEEELKKTVLKFKKNSFYSGAPPEVGRSRGLFEQQRVLYRLILGEIDLAKFCLSDPSWMDKFKVVSLFANTWDKDGRPIEERRRDPRILDLGWYEAELLSPTAPLVLHHFELDVKRGLRNGKNITRKKLENSETLPLGDLRAKLRELTQNLEHTILLVYDWPKTLSILHYLSVNCDHWRDDGLRSLLLPDNPNPDYRPPPRHHNPRDPRSRQRSLSPSPSTRLRSPPPPPRRSSVHIVDISALCRLLSITFPSVTEAARRLGVDVKPNEMCAANDTELLVRMWMSMSQGPAIDEQTQRRSALNLQALQQGTRNTAPAVEPANEDDDIDPNNIDPGDIQRASRDARGTNPYDELLDEEDYDEE
ncbi:hypothetical protein OE88DRAFT_1653108 [Heliocybe sulcata]|uniref:Uncharacterized protein n=1 Tax=Heliocybe sulcata TaxID=5364 RepID=A0A5C3NDX1_9AGAM|nr:hypothetical protein OE88DRAFT_1653108 [Heliocybe sulcata]